ncbi:MAG TPA: ABC-F family ATP-binding cassette domain-containing protein, partial [Ilumatobacteraceae bacterium]|nr:ABC-F family ATP-binding cassette domain-containing protein [Ilumatobacteraceae bacterium]
KSTLLRVLAGLQRPDAGTVSLAPPTATVGYLDQVPERTEESVLAYVERRTGVLGAHADLDAATAALAAGSAGSEQSYSIALDRWMALGAADLEVRIGAMWTELHLDDRLLQQSMRSLSGGEAARVSLAALMLARFDVMLLDEPTNDLDLDSLHRLERFVVNAQGTIALVSHDREFLRRVVTDVAELDEFTHGLTTFAGGYDAYLRERELARQHAWEAWEEYDAKKSTMAQRAQREREWATQGLSRAKKRPDDNDKNIKSFKINQTEQLAARAARTERAMHRLEVVDQPREPWDLRMTIATAPRSGALVASLDHAVVDRGSFRLGPLDVEIGYGERVVIVGPNGSGKTTLLGALLGDIELTSGTQRIGPSVRVGRLEQARTQLAAAASGQATTLGAFQAASGMTTSDARTLLAKFGIGAEHVHRHVDSLSPGERTRLVLALFTAVGSNCLVLDEPTNHLDLPAIEQIERAVDTFPGTVLLVTHDRVLLERIRRTRTIELREGQIVADRSE